MQQAARTDLLMPPAGLAVPDRTLRAVDAFMGTRAGNKCLQTAATPRRRTRRAVLAWVAATSPASTL
jgi:hypothetical protein